MLKKSLHLLLLIMLAGHILLGQTFQTKNGHAEVFGTATGTSYTGKSNELSGNVNLTTGEVNFKIPIETINTGNKTRNKHMNKALETEKYPEATFSGKFVSPFNPADPTMQEVKVAGIFTIHGESQPLEVTVSLLPGDSGIKFTGSWEIIITDYKISPPKMLFMKVKDLHKISIEGELVQ